MVINTYITHTKFVLNASEYNDNRLTFSSNQDHNVYDRNLRNINSSISETRKHTSEGHVLNTHPPPSKQVSTNILRSQTH